MQQNVNLLLEYIDEVSHKLNNQESIANKIANAIYDNLYNVKKNSTKIEVDISEYGTYADTATILIFTDGHIDKPYGQINDFRPLTIEIHVSRFWDMIPQEKLKSGIRKTIAHELMHGNIYSKRYDKVKDFDRETILKAINDYPNYYEDVLRIKSAEEHDSLIYYFTYALYTSYYHEVQAFVAQSDSYFKKVLWLNRDRKITNDNLRDILKNCEEYQTFVQNIHTVNTLRNMTDGQRAVFLEELNSKMSKGNEIQLDQLDGLLDKIETAANHALRNIENVLMYDYYDRD